MGKIKRLINFVLPVTACNFKCHYCYVGQEGRNTGDIGKLEYSPEHIQRCLTVERLGGVCLVNICGLGETLLPEYAVDLTIRMLENGHFVSVVTNGTITNRIRVLSQLKPELKERLFFKVSFHFLELERSGLTETFFENIRMIKNSGCAFSVELTVNDETVPRISEVQALCEKELDAQCHIIESRDNLNGLLRLTKMDVKDHQQAWRVFQSPLFEFQQTIWMKKRHEFCYAGDWICSLDVASGRLIPCFGGGNMLQNIFEDPEEPIHFCAIGKNCQWEHCYAAYVLLTTGAIPELNTPTYASFRDRVCSDGTTWLTPTVREFFSSKLCESNEEYPEGKKLYINALMALEYGNTDEKYNMEEVGQAVFAALQDRGIHTVAVWGCSRYSDWLFEVLRNTPVKMSYVVDTGFYSEYPPKLPEKLKRRYKYTIKSLAGRTDKPLLLNRYDRLPQTDAMVITDWANFNSIRQQIPPVYNHLLAVTQLADGG